MLSLNGKIIVRILTQRFFPQTSPYHLLSKNRFDGDQLSFFSFRKVPDRLRLIEETVSQDAQMAFLSNLNEDVVDAEVFY